MNDDSDWLDALAGRDRPAASTLAATEGRLMRRALQRLPATVPAQTPEQALSLLDGLLGRARAAGLMRERSGWCPACLQRWQRWRQSPGAWLGAGLVLAGLFAVVVVLRVVPVVAVDPAEEAVMRAPADGVWLLRVADPQQQRNELADRLAAGGARVQRYERLGRQGLEAELPLPLTPQLKQALGRLNIAAAPDGSLRVEFEPVAK
jgi:hypothetical protein